jgi:hypothetical protein
MVSRPGGVAPDDAVTAFFGLPFAPPLKAEGYKIGIDVTVLEGKHDCLKKIIEKKHKKKTMYSKVSTQKVLLIYTPRPHSP